MKHLNFSLHKYKCTRLVLALFLLLGLTRTYAQQCSWTLSATSTMSTCEANGKVTLVLSGTADGVVQYSLTPIDTGHYGVPPTTASVLENIHPGTYRATATGVCQGSVVSASTTVTVAGSYVNMQTTTTVVSDNLYNCNNGNILVSISGGSQPYTIHVAGPSGYTGPATIGATGNTNLTGLTGGTYQISVSDNCGATTALQTVTVNTIGPLTRAYLVFPGAASSGQCNQLIVSPPWVSLNGYANQISYRSAYTGISVGKYRSSNENDTLQLPAGKTVKDMIGSYLTYYVYPNCGTVIIDSVQISAPQLQWSRTQTCDTTFDSEFWLSGLVCYPVAITTKNLLTNTTFIDTLHVVNESSAIRKLSYGSYTISYVTADGFVDTPYANQQVLAPVVPAQPYRIQILQNGPGEHGHNRAVAFRITRTDGADVPAGTKAAFITGSSQYVYSATSPYASQVMDIFGTQEGLYYYPGSFVFRVTDGCTGAPYDLSITVLEEDVCHYSWDSVYSIAAKVVPDCQGWALTPKGYVNKHNVNQQVFYRLLSCSNPDAVFNSSVSIPDGGTFILKDPGVYRVGMATLQGTGIEEDYATESNTELVNIISPISFSIDQALGWVCPGKSDSSGAIIVTAKGGVPNTSGTYLYKLALAGQAQAGPYLDSNYTGRFEPATTGANYRLVKNHNYEVWVGDECKASKIQGVQVLDFATAQVASSDKPEYCYGDDVMLSVINLPSKATTFRWTYPDGEISTVQNPFISNVDANDAGVYHVVISSDICENPILADVNVVLAPYIISCYSAVTDTSVNPYAYGLLGNWHQSTSYVYYGARASSDPAGQTDIRHDGTFADFTDFLSFWSDQDAGKTDTTKWVWNATSTMFNKYGFELENKDPLGRYNAGIYGYDDALAVAVVQNSRFREAAFDGFEDYYFKSGNCDEACPASRSFDFSLFKNKLDSTQSHSGRYSMRVVSGDSVGIMASVTDTDLEGSTPSFVYGYNTCIGKNGLQSVRTNANILVPVFEPMGNKQVLISAWVKEAQNCQCTSYTNSQIHIAFKSSDNDNATIVIAKPAGAIIDGWQRIEQVVTLPPHTVSFSVALEALGSGVAYFDDIRIHPYNANMKSFVYDPQNLRLMAELDENNYATFYEYDDDGTLIRVKRETERGIKTITETRSALIKQ